MAKAAAESKPRTPPKTPGKAKTIAKPATKRAAVQPAAKPATRASTAKRPVPTKKLATKKPGPQRFTVSHLREKDFVGSGLRPYALYRDLGIAKATNGLAQAHVIRLIPPCTDEVRERHTHNVEFQMVYVLKGWIKNELEGQGEQLMKKGSCWLQPPNIKHTVLDYSDDCEMLEIIIPADFTTAKV